MSRCQSVSRPLATCAKHSLSIRPRAAALTEAPRRLISSTTTRQDAKPTTMTRDETLKQQAYDLFASELSKKSVDEQKFLDPNTTTAPAAERQLLQQGILPIGSRRRRVAVRTSSGVPFEQQPYQCFQEARKILQADREEKLTAIRTEVAKIKRVEANPVETYRNGEYHKQRKLESLKQHVEELKILADINDPMVKKRFEDGLGDLNKPIYRHFAHQKWLSMRYKMLKQRVDQLNIVPDVLPSFDPKMDVQIYFRQHRIEPGAIVDAIISELPPLLRVQTFDTKKRLVTVVVMDSDVPDPDKDGFARRCHYLAANIPLDIDTPSIALGQMKRDTQIAVPWLPAFSQKGSPYHRLSIFICEQENNAELDIAKLRELYQARDGFSLKSFKDKFRVTPYGFNIFRTVWDDTTAAVMERNAIPGADVEFRRTRVYSEKTPRKAKGWEAKHSGPKYRHLAKYTERIRRR